MTSALETARAVDPVINRLGAGLMFHPAGNAVGAEHGIEGLAWYLRGRCGVLGDAPTPVIVAATAWFQPDAVVAMLGDTDDDVAPTQVAAWYGDGLAAAARATWGDVDGLERFCTLARRMIDAVPLAGLALFSGWRARAWPDDSAGASGLAVQTLRELRGDRHIQAMAGFDPLEAALLTGGADQATMFGWSEPWPEVEHLQDARDAAEARTDDLMAQAYAVLDETERGEFAAVVTAMKHAAKQRR